ncbi:MAG: LON peptidase substrate-binding domain-containing protein [Candidatus Eremiobacteraeota bacterium]|nr:LON peptidase substrate-binding domain-containing protein [Candidatus Eremiobacteraeota bacterium]
MADRLRLFPLNTVLFPGAVLNLHVFEPRYKQMISECLEGGETFGVCLIREGDEAGDPAVMPHEIGTTAEIGDVTPLENGRYYISTTGRRRFRIEGVVEREPYLTADVAYLPEEEPTDVEVAEGLVREIRDVFRDYLRLLVEFSGMQADVDLPTDPIDASFLIGDALQVADSMKQRLLELPSTEQRLTVELGFLRRLLPQLRAFLERKQEPPSQPAQSAPTGGVFRAKQETFFGKHFSVN